MLKYGDRKCGTYFMSAENMSENMSTDLPDILCHNNPGVFHQNIKSLITLSVKIKIF